TAQGMKSAVWRRTSSAIEVSAELTNIKKTRKSGILPEERLNSRRLSNLIPITLSHTNDMHTILTGLRAENRRPLRGCRRHRNGEVEWAQFWAQCRYSENSTERR